MTRISQIAPPTSRNGSNFSDRRQFRSYSEHCLAIPWELRAATNLARPWQNQHKTKDNHGLPAMVYGRFTEGFDTVDLKGAKELLEEPQ